MRKETGCGSCLCVERGLSICYSLFYSNGFLIDKGIFVYMVFFQCFERFVGV